MNIDLTTVHNLSGPIAIEGAEPGDCLVVDILDVTPFEKMPWGYTGIFELNNGGGLFAREFNSKAAKAIWDFHGVYATSRHVPGVRFAGVSHPGLIGTAPSAELLATWNKREGALISEHPNSVPPVAFPPEPKGAYVGQDLDAKVLEKIAQHGARTIPGREHGGNCDPSPIDPLYSQKLIFEGISVDYHGDGKQYNMDATVAYKQAALNAINYLRKLGYTREQAYILLSAAPIESHVGAIVDSPNACVTLALPIGIFEHDILPKPDGLKKLDFGQCAIRSDGVV
ncbi:hypothetical protein E1B28_011691 [Marasmius oreades]|uniref:Formamidase n=1 Tax=Marasmius oreades TaxID=181124 RepID=A0A9P7RUN0_9AGAR|nr:uncharacterized protein E1B28_011691 [Marasmius oreades]KAG7090074.1 hypothetical protein E1B28_011691 [Marasmius oreades]